MTKSMGFSGSFLITIIIIHPLTTAQLLRVRPLIDALPVLSLAGVRELLISWLVDINWSSNCTYAVFEHVGGFAEGKPEQVFDCWLRLYMK